MGLRIAGALKDGQFETVLQAGHHDRRPVQCFGHLGAGVSGVHWWP